jgi:5-methoxybenzimidazole methyltransferase
MKVLLIQQDMGIRETRYPIFPIGLSYIAAVLRQHTVKIFDPNAYALEEVNNALTTLIRTFSPDIVGLSIRNIDTTNYRFKHVHFKTVQPMLELVKQIKPDAHIMVGGPGFSLFAKPIMQDIKVIDFGIYLEGEESTPELLDDISLPEKVKGIFYRQAGRVIYTGDRSMPDFAKVPWPIMDSSVINMRNYLGPSYNIMGIQTKRGCVLKCGYCAYPALNGRQLRLREPKDIVDQIEYLVKTAGIKRFTFVDSVFNVPEQHARNILNEMIDRNIQVEFGVWCHMRDVTEDFLRLLKRAGAVQVDFSPDAATDKGLKSLKKGITEKDIFNTVKAARKVKGLGYGFGFFAGLPGYNIIDTIKTWIMPFRIQFMLPGRGGGAISYIRIEPETLLQQIAIQDGLIDSEDSLLPADEEDLARMFYRLPSHTHLNRATDALIALMERILKPGMVKVVGIISKARGKKSVYDQKTGFVPFQKMKK